MFPVIDKITYLTNIRIVFFSLDFGCANMFFVSKYGKIVLKPFFGGGEFYRSQEILFFL